MLVSDRLVDIAMERDLRRTTVTSYTRLLRAVGIYDSPVESLDKGEVLENLYRLSPNTRRSAVIAIRSVLGWSIKIPRSIPRKYDLPSEDTLRMALMLSKFEARGLLMMYAGLRIGEACAVRPQDRDGDRLTVARQVIEDHVKGKPVTRTIGPVKGTEASIVIPHWLHPIVDSLGDFDYPAPVRESLRRAGVKVGIKLNPHMLRHWYCTTLIDRGIPLAQVSKQMRHSDIAVTLRTYSQYRDAAIHDVLG